MRESMDSREAFTVAEEEAYQIAIEAESRAAQEDKLGSEYEEWLDGVEAAEVAEYKSH